MNDVEKMWETWKNRPYESVVSYALGKQPRRVQELLQTLFRRCMVARLLRISGKPRFRRVVDLGCAAGDWTIAYARLADQAVGVDINPSFIDEARRKAEALGCADKVAWQVQNLVDFEDYAGADLVAIGACLMYVDDGHVERLLDRVFGELAVGGHLYVRASVAQGRRESYATPKGFYRRAELYRALFEHRGFAILDESRSATVVAHEIARAPLGPGGRPMLDPGLKKIIDLAQFPKRFSAENDYMNWILRLDRR